MHNIYTPLEFYQDKIQIQGLDPLSFSNTANLNTRYIVVSHVYDSTGARRDFFLLMLASIALFVKFTLFNIIIEIKVVQSCFRAFHLFPYFPYQTILSFCLERLNKLVSILSLFESQVDFISFDPRSKFVFISSWYFKVILSLLYLPILNI